MIGALAEATDAAGHHRRDLPDRAHPPGDHRPGRGDQRACCSTGASTSASAAARRSTSTSSATTGRRPTCGWRCSRRRSRSCGRCGRAGSGATAGATTRSRTRASTTCPTTPPPVLVSGFGPKAVQLAAKIGDGFVTTSPDKEAIELYRSEGGKGPVHAGTKVCFMDDEERRATTVLRLWPNEGLPGELAQVLPTPSHFEQACELVTAEQHRHAGRARPRRARRVARSSTPTPASTSCSCSRSALSRTRSSPPGRARSSRGSDERHQAVSRERGAVLERGALPGGSVGA